MDLLILRTYDPTGSGTNGDLYLRICHTIELPWLDNMRNHSCIPEGRYELEPRFTTKRKDHFEVLKVPGRDGILVHTANDALTQLRGCIAPVTTLTGPGAGTGSKAALERLNACTAMAFQREQQVYLTIKQQKP